MRITILLLTLSMLAASQLPPEILVDRHMVRVDRLFDRRDYQGALDALNDVAALQREHALTVPAEFHFKYAQVAVAAGLDTVAVESVGKYLLTAGAEGEFYRDALRLLDAAEERIRLADAERRRQELARRRVEELQRQNDALAERQVREASEPFRDSLHSGGFGPQMTTVAAGRFQYWTTLGRTNDRVEWVTIPRPFAISTYEVTRGEFARFVDRADYRAESRRDPEYGCNAPSTSRRERNSSLRWNRPGFRQTDMHPVTCVSIRDALAYVRWLSEETGQRYRVPRAAEWQYAARAGGPVAMLHDRARTMSREFTTCRTAHRYECYPDGHRMGAGSTIEVGKLSPNGIGLHDMYGNVEELVFACKDGDLDPRGLQGRRLNCVYSATMGGSWFSFDLIGEIRVNKRRSRDSYERNSHNWTGFRIVRDIGD